MQPQIANSNHAVNYYTILGLSQPNDNFNSVSLDQLKTAYHRALLRHHPDKALRRQNDLTSAREAQPHSTQYNVAEIIQAYQILADPKLRQEYDNQLRLKYFQRKNLASTVPQNATHLGLEVCDLEEMVYNEEQGMWYRSCRCGNEKGYTVTEDELENASTEGEIYVGCHGCSLHIKVLFSLAEDDGVS